MGLSATFRKLAAKTCFSDKVEVNFTHHADPITRTQALLQRHLVLLHSRNFLPHLDPEAILRLDMSYLNTKYVGITAVRDEEEHLPHTIQCMLQQTILPVAWIIVNEG